MNHSNTSFRYLDISMFAAVVGSAIILAVIWIAPGIIAGAALSDNPRFPSMVEAYTHFTFIGRVIAGILIANACAAFLYSWHRTGARLSRMP